MRSGGQELSRQCNGASFHNQPTNEPDLHKGQALLWPCSVGLQDRTIAFHHLIVASALFPLQVAPSSILHHQDPQD